MDGVWEVLSMIFAGGWISQFAYMKIERRRKSTEVVSMEIDTTKKIDDMQEGMIENAYNKIVKLQGIIDELRDKITVISEQASSIKLELIAERERRKIAERSKCEKMECLTREPPLQKE